MRPAILTFLLLAALATLAAGCGGYGGKKKSGASSGTPIKTITIDEKEFLLTPNSVQITKPGTYVIEGVNKGTIDHAIAIEGNGLDQDAAAVAPGKTTKLTVAITKSGSYTIYCPVDGHKQMGMKGTLTLGSSSAGGGGTTTGGTTSGRSGY